MGNTDSDWEGVRFDAPANLVSGNVYSLTGMAATNTIFVNKTSGQYTTDTFFFGQVIEKDSNWVV